MSGIWGDKKRELLPTPDNVCINLYILKEKYDFEYA